MDYVHSQLHREHVRERMARAERARQALAVKAPQRTRPPRGKALWFLLSLRTS